MHETSKELDFAVTAELGRTGWHEALRLVEARDRIAELDTCQWLDQFKRLPPPIDRQRGGFLLRAEDCDTCVVYEPVAIEIPGTRSAHGR